MKHTKYEMHVRGYSWGGFDAEYTYPLKEVDALAIKTLADAKRKAGDFESLDSFEVVKIVTQTEYTTIAEEI